MSNVKLTDAQIFVVDDEPANVTLITRILRRAGYQSVRGFSDSLEALEMLTHASPDLIMLDLRMPHLDGLTFLRKVRDQTPATEFVPVIVLTADASRAALRQALEEGADEFVTKPFDNDEVLLRVRNLLSIRFSHQVLQQHNTALASELRARTRSDREEASDRDHKIDVIRRIVARGGPTMVFQPIADLETGATVGVEALARFGTEPQRGPDKWFADAATVGLGTDLEISAICAAVAHLSELDPEHVLAVNVSAETMFTPEFRSLIPELPLDRMAFEVTEHQPVDDYDALSDITLELRGYGALLCVDDAGAGYASLRHILNLRPDVIKLDITLTRDVDRDPVKRALAASLATFATEIGAAITAEGIETESELKALRGLGIHYGQGFFLAHPGTARSAQISSIGAHH